MYISVRIEERSDIDCLSSPQVPLYSPVKSKLQRPSIQRSAPASAWSEVIVSIAYRMALIWGVTAAVDIVVIARRALGALMTSYARFTALSVSQRPYKFPSMSSCMSLVAVAAFGNSTSSIGVQPIHAWRSMELAQIPLRLASEPATELPVASSSNSLTFRAPQIPFTSFHSQLTTFWLCKHRA